MDPFLKSNLSLAVLHGEGKVENLIDKLQISEIGFANIIAPSLRNLADMLSILAALSVFKSQRIFMTSSFETGENLKFEFSWLKKFS